jgi:hypothetical protein
MKMKIAIMQPYLFPYIGYFQLINAVDKFIVYDDVNYIKKGWINKNKILVNSSPYKFALPIKNASQNRLINELEIAGNNDWNNKFLKTIETSYKNTPFFIESFKVVESIIYSGIKNLSEFIFNSLELIIKYLEVKVEIIRSSSIYGNSYLKGEQRIIDICEKESCSEYLNPIGGVDLYNKSEFEKKGIKLKFLKSEGVCYNQFGKEFIPNLSIIDVIMFNSTEIIGSFLNKYSIIEPNLN